MVDLRRVVVKKIGGLPLLAKTLAEEFVTKDLSDIAGHSEWKLDWDSNVWEPVRRTLESDYVRLPSHLKPCFKYLSLFPEGSWIVKEVLIQFWMAEGFIPLEDEMGENMEELGEEYFDDLLSRTSFFKDIERDDDDNIVRCKIHETFHDFVRHTSRWDHTYIKNGSSPGIIESTRHSSIFYAVDSNFISTALHNGKRMHTLLCFGNPENFEFQRELFSHLKVLRVIDFSSTKTRNFSYPIRALEHLRYIDLSYTRIKELPESICGLCFLQTLKLSHSLLRALPTETRKLISLRHLEIEGTCMSYLPDGMERLTRLQKLTDFIVGGETRCSIGELGNLNLLQGRLIISNLNRLKSREVAAKANLNKKNRINCLILDGKKHFRSQRLDRRRYFDPPILEHMYEEAIGLSNEIDVNENEMKRVQDVFEGIKPHVNLRRLEIWNYSGHPFPEWIKDAVLMNLIFLKLVKCVKVKDLPPLGNLPSLQCLHMRGMEVENIGGGFYGDGDRIGFPKLERLVLEGMPRWKKWDLSVEAGHMPCVAELILSDCPNLKTLPSLPNSLRKLEIYNCEVRPHNLSLPTVEHLVLKGKDGMLRLLPNLPKLESLKITLSSGLTLIPDGLGNLITLKTLAICFCPKLRSLPQELQNLTKLQELVIVGCPLLKDWLDDWLKKAHIPNIEIDNKKVQRNQQS